MFRRPTQAILACGGKLLLVLESYAQPECAPTAYNILQVSFITFEFDGCSYIQYRDGVSEGQFQEVGDKEVDQIKRISLPKYSLILVR
jgi:hypothetical protein